ncbi:MAG: hypothetical protein JRJ56_03700 [Deltaproteobacteria bacterium]|nr:hypothetical protein [Deltaproteobacteria bacterium]
MRTGKEKKSGRRFGRRPLVLLTVLLALAAATPARAHKVMVFAWISGNQVHTESKFSGGRRVKAGKIEVFDQDGKLLLTGTTDDQGKYNFPLPAAKELKIVLTAGMGHRGEWRVSREEIKAARAEASTGRAAKPADGGGEIAPAADSRPAAAPAMSADQPAAVVTLSRRELRQLLDQALDRKLEPVIRMLTEAREHRPSLTDILGGIGYIIGLVGLAAYLRQRQKKE